MAVTHRTATRALALHKALQDQPYIFSFYSALRQLEAAHPSSPRLGESLRPKNEPIRLAQEPLMAFAPASLSAFDPGSSEHKARLEVLFFGLFGPNGPLPLHLTEYARDRLLNADDPTLCRFADMFHHRLLSLFYRAWANNQPTVHFDRPEGDRFATYVGATCGYAMPSLKSRDEMPDISKLHYAGWLANQTRNGDGLGAILADFFQLPVKIEQFVGHWMSVPEDARCRLGESPETGTLGINSTIGAQVWTCQTKFRITMGPLNLTDYRRMLPTGNSLKHLVAIVRNYINDELEWDLNLILKKEQVKPIQLGQEGQLGWTTWLTNKPIESDGDNLMLNPYIRLG